MRVFLLITLVVLAIVAWVVTKRRAATPDVRAINPIEMNTGSDDPDPTAIDPESEGYWAKPLPAGLVQITDKDVAPEFTVDVTPVEKGERRALRFTIREKHGLRVDAIQLKLTHLVADAATGELVVDQKVQVPLSHFARKPLEAGGVLEDEMTLTGLEFSELSDGKLGTSENWQATVVTYSRLAKKVEK